MTLDFYQVKEREGAKKGVLEVYPDFRVTRTKDLMVRGSSFYALWDDEIGLWSTDEYDVQRLVDKDIQSHEITTPPPDGMVGWNRISRKFLGDFSTSSWLQFRNYVGHLSDSSIQLDETLTFANDEVKKEDYVSKRLPYSLIAGDHSAWDELLDVLYKPEERAKIEWAIGAIISGDSKTIQKFLVFYGPGGTGKSTVMNVIEKLFEGYVGKFDAKALTSQNNTFATDVFRTNPLVVIQHDTDLSKIEDNSKFNSIVSHEAITMNEKFKSSYDARVIAMALIGTNKPVKIPDAKSGLIRRLIDVHPTGDTIAPRKYQSLVSKVDFELGAIAAHCLEVYREMGKNFYEGYRPTEMMLQTDVFFNFIEAEYDWFQHEEGVTLKAAYERYKAFIEETGVEYKLAQYRFREELRNYFDSFEDRAELADGTRVRSWYTGFKADRFKVQIKDDMQFSLVMDETVSLLDTMLADQPAQYSNAMGNPKLYWTNAPKMDSKGKEFIPKDDQVCSTFLRDLDTHKEHYTKLGDIQHIVIDFDLEDEYGAKNLEKNLEAASQWPATYAEFSKSGTGIHLHYIYVGDVELLCNVFEPGIEIKVYKGDTALRRRLTKCNNIPVATLNGGLPLKEKKSVMTTEKLGSELALRELIARNLRKEIHPGTASSVSFIHKILLDAYNDGLTYDVSDLRNKVLAFANNSTHQALQSIKLVTDMKWTSNEAPFSDPNLDHPDVGKPGLDPSTSKTEVFFDVEVFPNLFVICWKGRGSKSVVRMINPTAQAVEELFSLKLVGFNNRRYDNHILYAAMMGYNNEQLYKLSQKLVDNEIKGATFGAAYNLSYTDIYDFSSANNRMSLKAWEIKLGLKHDELGLPWDQPVPEALWERVAEYCANDVEATEQVFEYLKDDWTARQILSTLSGLSVNETTNKHSTRIIFGDERRPQSDFVYTDLSLMFPGYKFDLGKSHYRDEIAGEGGYVYSEPGMYANVAVLDVASMHPTSIEQLNLFGKYTHRFSEIKNARVKIKRSEYDEAKEMLGGRLAPFLTDEDSAKGLSDALKTVINSVYGLTAARFDNSFKDPRNIDNIVAKRGALFMIDLKYFVQAAGYKVVHIKTDSIKIPDADEKIINMVKEFGANYGYEFEHEATYSKFCLVNDAVYIAKVGWAEKKNKIGKWEAVGAQFQDPFVYKTLFTHEPIEFKDKTQTRQVSKGALYLDFNDPEIVDKPMIDITEEELRKPHFVGKTGLFCPIQKGKGGAVLLRIQEGKAFSASGAKGYFWMESDMVKSLGKENDIDMGYFEHLVNDAKANISKYGDFEWLVEEEKELMAA